MISSAEIGVPALTAVRKLDQHGARTAVRVSAGECFHIDGNSWAATTTITCAVLRHQLPCGNGIALETSAGPKPRSIRTTWS